MTRPAVIFDIDGTLADIDHRRHLVTIPKTGEYDTRLFFKKNWKEFFARMEDDVPVQPIVNLLDLYKDDGKAIILATGRSEFNRKVTEAWLDKHDIAYTALYMRADSDFREDHIVKREMLAKIRADGYAPFLVVDDRKSVVDMWRSEGLTCLQCAPGDF